MKMYVESEKRLTAEEAEQHKLDGQTAVKALVYINGYCSRQSSCNNCYINRWCNDMVITMPLLGENWEHKI